MSGIIPKTELPDKNPTACLFAWLKKKIGARSVGAIRRDSRAAFLVMDDMTLKRWSAGKHFPKEKEFQSIVDAFFDEKEHGAVWLRYWAAKCLNFMGYMAQCLVSEARRLAGTQDENVMAPWPNLPFDYPDFTAWLQARYQFWFDYHVSRQTDLLSSSR